ncbi:MAG: hypothetical protein FWF18_02420 [Dehalococcoidia bacterium]|nr:hypothetical protein [Dehalococcoidia bacterium]
MKKLKLIALLSLVTLTPVVMVACWGKSNEKSNELETRIRTDYLSHLHSQGEPELILADIKILKIYGDFDGVVVVRFDRPAFEAITTVQVDGVDFVFDNTNVAIVWKDGSFFELQEAYDNELLTKGNLKSIQTHYGQHSYTDEEIIENAKAMSLEDDFAEGIVDVIIKHANSVHDTEESVLSQIRNALGETFESISGWIPIEEIESNPLWNRDGFRQIVTVTLRAEAKEDVFNAVTKLNRLDFVLLAQPRYNYEIKEE